MKLSNAIEIVQGEHPEKPVKVIAEYIKNGYKDFALKSKYIRSSHLDITLGSLDVSRGRWNLKYDVGFSDIETASYRPIGILDMWYNGIGVPSIGSAGLSPISYVTNHAINGFQLALTGALGGLDDALLQVNTFGFDPRIISSNTFSEDMGLGSDYEFYSIYHALKAFNIGKNLTVQASYYDRELTRILRDAKKEIAKLKTPNLNIQVDI